MYHIITIIITYSIQSDKIQYIRIFYLTFLLFRTLQRSDFICNCNSSTIHFIETLELFLCIVFIHSARISGLVPSRNVHLYEIDISIPIECATILMSA